MKTNQPLNLYFDSLSATYKVNEFASLFITNFMRKKLVNRAQNYKHKSILDIMSGQGENLKYIGSDCTDITTLDYSAKMNRNAKQLTSKKIDQIEKDFFNFIPTRSYDIVLCSFGVKTIEEERIHLFAKKINNLVNGDGEVLLLELVRPRLNFIYRFLKFYQGMCIPKLFGEQFRLLFPYVSNHRDMNNLKTCLVDQKMEILEHRRFLDMFEIIHAKKPKYN